MAVLLKLTCNVLQLACNPYICFEETIAGNYLQLLCKIAWNIPL